LGGSRCWGPPGVCIGSGFFFLLYINVITSGLACNIKLFADDTSLFIIIDDSNYIEASEILSTNLSRIYNWSRDWAIKFNPNKTESVLFTRKNNVDCPNVYFGNPDNIVTDVEMHCHLGLDFQINCKWKNHITKIYEKTCDRLKILRMLRHQVSRKVLINIYLSFIRPVLEYADIVWDNCTLHESNLLESVQVEAGRIITGLKIIKFL
jgi:hypothetical protein